MGPRMKPCPHSDCDKMIQEQCSFCREHTNWKKVAAKRNKNIKHNTFRKCQNCGNPFRITSGPNIHCKKCRTFNCAICGNKFIKSLTDTRTTCSKKCSYILNSPPILICERCGKEFIQRNGRKTKYCSKKCRYLSARINERETVGGKHRNSQYRQWRKNVFKRDRYICQYPECNQTKDLHAHHIKPWDKSPELAYAVSNGITLCYVHHGKIHGQNWQPNKLRINRPSNCARCNAKIKGYGKPPGHCHSCAQIVKNLAKLSK